MHAKVIHSIPARMTPDPVAIGPVLWLIGVGVLGLVLGISLPYLIESSLEFYAVCLCAIVLAGIFAMPRSRTYDDSLCWGFFLAALALFAVYPAYISLQISGLPWISPLRMAMLPLLLIWLHALRTSPEMQGRIAFYVQENRFFFILLAVFIVSQVLSIPTSRNPAQALQKFLLFQFYWTFPFFVVLTLVNTGKRLQLMPTLFIAFAVIQCLVGFLEARQERLLWLDYLPPGFGAESEILTRIIQGTFRAEGYRVQGSFTVSLVYAEFLVLMLPFALFAFVDGKTRFIRTAGLLAAVAILPAQYLSGSRLGMVGSITVFLMLVGFYVVRVWRTEKRNMTGPLLLLLLPFAMTLVAAAFVASPRLQALTIGGGAHQASTDSRMEMWIAGIPRILERPLFGHGSGLGAETLGFTNLAGFLTIDSYWLSSFLEFGIVGTFALFAMIAWAVRAGFSAYVSADRQSGAIGAAIAVALVAFTIVKLVLSQADNHMLVFVLFALAMIIKSGGARPDLAVQASLSPVPGPSPGRPALYLAKVRGHAAATRAGKPAALERVSRDKSKLTSTVNARTNAVTAVPVRKQRAQ